MDTLGAVFGPLLALLYLYFYPGQYRALFLLAFVPGAFAIGLSFYLNENKTRLTGKKAPMAFFSFLRYWKDSPVTYRKIVAGLLVFTLCNSSDVFLLLRIKQGGLNDTATIGVYIFYNLVYSLAAFPLGVLADRLGLKKIFVAGLLFFVLVYSGMTVSGSLYWYGLLFCLYGIYAAATEGISKAWISNITGKSDTATAIGTYTGLQSLCAMVASIVTGWLWFRFGASTAFLITAIIAAIVLLYFLLVIPEPLADVEKSH